MLPTINSPTINGRSTDVELNSTGSSNIGFKLEPGKPVYPILSEHQRTEERWELSPFVAELQRFAAIFNEEFDLGLSEIAICVDWLPENRYGHFRHGFNGFGLSAEIAINRHHLHRETSELLGTLLHELLHAWQERYGKPGQANYHNKEFRDKAAALGLIIDAKGRTTYSPGSPFFAALEKHGAILPELPAAVSKRKKASTKLRKWCCRCHPPINVRVAIPSFEAVCLRCSQRFEQQD